jgi:glucose-1-phosphate thymidylyltransferase
MRKLVGLVPAAGQGKRVSLLPCSKEIFPVGFTVPEGNGDQQARPKPISLYLLERMMLAGVSRVIIVLSREKWDVVRYYGGGAQYGLDIAYLVQDNAWGMPYALAVASPWLDDATVLFGMPDTIFSPIDAYERLLIAHSKTDAELTLGLFPTATPQRFGMVAYDTSFRMLHTVDKPRQTASTCGGLLGACL